jgi:uncharacterized protein YbcI
MLGVIEYMEFSIKDKNLMLKTVTTHIKDVKGRGPQNIYIKYYDNELHIVIQGALCALEKYALKHYKQEAVRSLERFYDMNNRNMEAMLDDIFNRQYNFNVYEMVLDFYTELFVYKVKVT